MKIRYAFLVDNWLSRWVPSVFPAAKRAPIIYCSSCHPWWTHNRGDLVIEKADGVFGPTLIEKGIRNDPVIQVQSANFWHLARTDRQRYGKHGFVALVAAFHGNTIVNEPAEKAGFPTAADDWAELNEYIDEFMAFRGIGFPELTRQMLGFAGF